MSQSNWQTGIAALVFLFLAAAIIFAFGYDFGRYFPARQSQSTQQSIADNYKAETRLFCLRKKTPSAILECANQQYEKYEEDTRERRDLYAQEGMERWAFYLLIASVVTTVATGGGVFLLWRDIATARDIGEKQLRPYLIVSKVSAEFLYSAIGSPYAVQIRIIVTNGGATPAIRVGRNITVTNLHGDRVASQGIIWMQGTSHVLEDIPGAGEQEVMDATLMIGHLVGTSPVETLHFRIEMSVNYSGLDAINIKHLIANYVIQRRNVKFDIRRTGENSAN
ncbi:hypothetical protein ACFQ14_10770 [Pseudahrensia aquimaris]|uniref:DUF4352 domain-containing protein n=1 Tax=Pseudahrensia aquimaris TaxID=744461 RepID=A0ABW3FJ80_9HYPH